MQRSSFHLVLFVVLVLVCAAATPAAATAASVHLASAGAGPAWTALGEVLNPVVTGVDPATAANDVDTPVTITGGGFATDPGTGAPPVVTLGATLLTDVAYVDGTTLTATVPWGIDPGVYDLTVTNPDGGAGTLPAACTVTAGLARWNGVALDGGDVRCIVMKPGSPQTLYAQAYGLTGLFRSTDGAATWQFTGGALPVDTETLAVTPQHPDWLYAYIYRGVEVSKDDGATWSLLMPADWPDGKPIADGRVYPSPYDPQLLFVSASYDPAGSGHSGDATGLIRSTDGGATWHVVPSLSGELVAGVAFFESKDPAQLDPTRMVAVTRDGKVFQSGDSGKTWTQTTGTLPAGTAIGANPVVAYNPYTTGEVWILSNSPDHVFKSADAALSGWLDETPPSAMSSGLAFTGAQSVYLTHWHSADGGATWQDFGPDTGNGSLLFDPGQPQTAYVGDGTYGVQKTTDGGVTWAPADHGLTGMNCSSLSVSLGDPLRVFAAFGNWAGLYWSTDGAASWSYTAAPGSDNPSMGIVLADPSDATGLRVYAASQHAVYRSDDGGATWNDLGFNTLSPQADGLIFKMAADPDTPGHLLASVATGPQEVGAGYLYSSTDYGASWQLVVNLPNAVNRITDIAFDPGQAGVVYCVAGGTGDLAPASGVFKSTDDGVTWKRIVAGNASGVGDAQTISIATHPQRLLFVGTQWTNNFHCYRSGDAGGSWQRAQQNEGAQQFLFAADNSSRLYAATDSGLFFSSNQGDSWSRAAGAFGRLQILALGDTQMDGRTLLYAATNGGQASVSGTAAGPLRSARGATTTLVKAGVYRYAVLAPKATLRLTGLRRGVLRLRRRVTAKGVVTPSAFAGSKVTLQVQRRARRWVKAKTVSCTIHSGGAYSWRYRPGKKGTYRVRATFAKTATHLASHTRWRTFRVR